MNLTVEKFKIGDVPIDVADKQSRENITTILQTITALQNNVSNLETSKANNADFTTQYTHITGTLIDGYVCNRKGNISLELGGSKLKETLSANTWTELLILPSGFRPLIQIYRTFYFGGSYPVILEIQKSGKVRAYSSTTLNTDVICTDGTQFI